MKLLVLFFSLLSFAAAKPVPKGKLKPKAPPKRVAKKISTGKELCQLMEQIAKAGVPSQKDIDFAAGKNAVVMGKVGAIGPNVGTVHLANIYLRGMATGTDGYVYKDKCLKIEFPDLDKDGVKDLEISATIQHFDAKANPPLQGTQEYKRTFIYHPEIRMYQGMDGSANPFVELLIQ